MDENKAQVNTEKTKQPYTMMFSLYDDEYNNGVRERTLSIPQYAEYINGQNFVQYGSNNLYPEYLKQLINKSSKHAAVIDRKASLIGGNGFELNNISTETLNFITNPNGKEDLESILAKASYDAVLYGGFLLNVTWSKDRSRTAAISYVDPAKMRIEPTDAGDKYLLCDNWANTNKHKITEIDGFSRVNRKSANQILYVKAYKPGQEWYAIPDYLPITNWIELEWEISQWHLESVKNGFTPNMLITFPQGRPTDEEMQKTIRELRKEYQGGLNANKTMFAFCDGKDNAPIITPIQLNNSDERFIELNKQVTDGIMIGHGVTNQSLFGVKTAGELGNSNEYIDSLKIFQAMYVDSKQNMIQKVFNRLAAINNIPDKLIIKKHKIDVDVIVNTGDILNVLQAPVGNEQKIEIFLALGYTEDRAKKLVNSGTQNNTMQ